MPDFLNPSEILKKLDLQEDAVAADFGSGSGGWAIPLARLLKNGKVYAIDILEEPLSALKSRAKLEKLLNIQTIQADAEQELPLDPSSVDLVLMTNLLFQVEDKFAALTQAQRILKKDGKVLVVDWKTDAVFGPKEGRVGPEDIEMLARNIGLKTEETFEAGPYHWGLILVK